MSNPKIVKRYANRKLYDTERSCYVTLDEIAQMVKDGEEVQVLDNKTKEDLTAVTLAQILVEEEKRVAKMPLKLLRSIIQSSNEALGDFYQKRVADPAKHLRDDVEKRVESIRDDVEKRVESLFRRDEKADQKPEGPATSADETPGDGGDAETPAAAAEEGGPVRAFVASTSEAFENWQKRIDDQVRDSITAMTHLTHARSDFERLQKRVEELEARLAALSGSDQG